MEVICVTSDNVVLFLILIWSISNLMTEGLGREEETRKENQHQISKQNLKTNH